MDNEPSGTCDVTAHLQSVFVFQLRGPHFEYCKAGGLGVFHRFCEMLVEIGASDYDKGGHRHLQGILTSARDEGAK